MQYFSICSPLPTEFYSPVTCGKNKKCIILLKCIISLLFFRLLIRLFCQRFLIKNVTKIKKRKKRFLHLCSVQPWSRSSSGSNRRQKMNDAVVSWYMHTYIGLPRVFQVISMSSSWRLVTLTYVDFPHVVTHYGLGWLRCTVVERWSLTGELSLCNARPVADGWPLIWVNHPLKD